MAKQFEGAKKDSNEKTPVEANDLSKIKDLLKSKPEDEKSIPKKVAKPRNTAKKTESPSVENKDLVKKQEETTLSKFFDLLREQIESGGMSVHERQEINQNLIETGIAILESRGWHEGVKSWSKDKIIEYVDNGHGPLSKIESKPFGKLSEAFKKRMKGILNLSAEEIERINRRIPNVFKTGDRIYDPMWGQIIEVTDTNPPDPNSGFVNKGNKTLNESELKAYKKKMAEQDTLRREYEKKELLKRYVEKLDELTHAKSKKAKEAAGVQLKNIEDEINYYKNIGEPDEFDRFKAGISNGERAGTMETLERELSELYEELGEIDDEIINILCGKRDWLNDIRARKVQVRKGDYEKKGEQAMTVSKLTNVMRYRHGYELRNIKHEKRTKDTAESRAQIGSDVEITRTYIGGKMIKPGDVITEPLFIEAVKAVTIQNSPKYILKEIKEEKNNIMLVLAPEESPDKEFVVAQGMVVSKILRDQTKRLEETPINMAGQIYKPGETVTENYQQFILETFFKSKDTFIVKRVYFDLEKNEDILEFSSGTNDKNRSYRITLNKYEELIANRITSALAMEHRPGGKNIVKALDEGEGYYLFIGDKVNAKEEKRRQAALNLKIEVKEVK
ncbi:hypothetical protein IPF86_01645 [Candidatus Nomurabacteria bacterium]|jgi:hypothetical protein|nr:MAG: hypothetical protein IPF86_01645 [Candidatus Nomurabacteria bacterium]